MRQRCPLWLMGCVLLAGMWSASFASEPLPAESIPLQPLPVRDGMSVWLGYGRGYPPFYAYRYPPVSVYPYVYMYPYPYHDPYSADRPPATRAFGYLHLEVQPSEAEIYVDGNFVGRGQDFAGPAVLPVSPGGHVVEFRWREVGSQVRLFVSRGETVEVKQDLAPPKSGTSVPSAKRWLVIPRSRGY